MNRAQRRAAQRANSRAVPYTAIPESVNIGIEPSVRPEMLAPSSATPSGKEISVAQLLANRANAQRSTGPTSTAGRQKVSQNAVKTGLTGQQVLLPTDDASLYQELVVEYQKAYQPVGPEETQLVQSIIDTRWRLARIPGLESALLDLGRRLMLQQAPDLASNPPLVFEMQIRLHMDKDFRNLHLQENRLVRRREREMKELRQLQAARKAEKPDVVAKPAPAMRSFEDQPPQNGFVFTTEQINKYVATLAPAHRQTFLKEALALLADQDQTREAAA